MDFHKDPEIIFVKTEKQLTCQEKSKESAAEPLRHAKGPMRVDNQLLQANDKRKTGVFEAQTEDGTLTEITLIEVCERTKTYNIAFTCLHKGESLLRAERPAQGKENDGCRLKCSNEKTYKIVNAEQKAEFEFEAKHVNGKWAFCSKANIEHYLGLSGGVSNTTQVVTLVKTTLANIKSDSKKQFDFPFPPSPNS